MHLHGLIVLDVLLRLLVLLQGLFETLLLEELRPLVLDLARLERDLVRMGRGWRGLDTSHECNAFQAGGGDTSMCCSSLDISHRCFFFGAKPSSSTSNSNVAPPGIFGGEPISPYA